MQILVTAGNTQTPVDRVRCITNIFSGRTGGGIAQCAASRGHDVCLLTSHPEVVSRGATTTGSSGGRLQIRSYRTFDELDVLMAEAFRQQQFDAVIHAAAVSDYRLAEVLTPELRASGQPSRFVDASAGKVRSSHSELWLRLVPTPKLVDKIRRDWRFRGVLIKFKLEVDVSEQGLLDIAEASRVHSAANLMVANTLDGMHDWAWIGDSHGYERIARPQLSDRLLGRIEGLCESPGPVRSQEFACVANS